MLAHMRKFAGSFFIKILLVILLASFVLWGAGDMIRNSSSSVVMKVGDVSYSAQEFNIMLGEQVNAISNQFGVEIDKEMLQDPMFQNIVLNQIINKSLLLQEAKSSGLLVSDEMVKYEIATIPYFQKDGRFNKDQFQMFLSNTGMSEARFIEVLKNDIISQNMASIFNVSRSVPEIKARNLAAARLSNREFKVIEISEDSVKLNQLPSDEDLKEIYEKHKESFSIPEKRDVSYIEFSINDVKSEIKVKDEELHEVYKARKSLFIVPEKRKVKHIIFASSQQAQKAQEAIKSGKTFEEVAKDYGKDKKVTDLGEITKEGLQTDIAEAVFSIHEGEFTDVKKSPLGYHIFHVSLIKNQSEKPYSEVKSDLEKSYVNEKKYLLFTDLANEISDKVTAGKSIDEISNEYGFSVKKEQSILENRKIENSTLSSNESFVKAAFATAEGSISLVTPNHDASKYFVLKVDYVKPKDYKDFSSVETELRKIWRNNEVAVALGNKATQIYEELKNNTDILAVQKKFDLNISSIKANYYSKELAGLGKNAFDMAISLEQGKFSIPVLSENKSHLIFFCEKISKPTEKDIAEKTSVIRQELMQTAANEFYGEFLASLRKKYDIVYDRKVIFPN